MIFTPTAFFDTPLAGPFVYYGATFSGSINMGFQKWVKGVQSATNGADPIPSASYTASVRSIENPILSSSYVIPPGQLYQITGSISGSSTTLMFTGTYPLQSGDEKAGNGVGYGMLVEGPSDLRSNPLSSMPRPIAKRIKVRTSLANTPFNYIDGTGSVVYKTLSTGVDYFIDVQGLGLSELSTNGGVWSIVGYAGPATGSFTPYVEGTRQYTATRTRGTNAVFNWVKQFATASMDMQNALVSATTYTFIAALPPAASNFTYGWSGSLATI